MATVAEALALAEHHRRAGNLPQAEEVCRQVLRADPVNAPALHLLGVLAQQAGRHDLAITYLGRALALDPRDPACLYNLALAHQSQGRPAEAEACYREALHHRPDYPEAYHNLGAALLDQGRPAKAEACYREVLRRRPDCPQAHTALGSVLQQQGRLGEAHTCFREALRLEPDNAATHSSLLLSRNYDPDVSPAALLAEHLGWAERHAAPLAHLARPHANHPDPDRRLRVGYVSPDLRDHVLAFFLESVLAHHDPAAVEVFCYAEVAAPDETTARLRSRVHDWRSTCGLSDERVAEHVRADGIDVLVDLAGHMPGNRLLAFARRPAPVQVTYLGYPGTTGLSAVDYRLTDAVADPEGEPSCHAERLWRLPGCFCCYAPRQDAPDVTPLPASAAGPVTFGSLHGLAKLNGAVLDLWCRLLRAVPSARLQVSRHMLRGEPRERLAAEFARRGLPAERLDLRSDYPPDRAGHLRWYADIDVALDTFPWCGHATACEALWMGVPVLTLQGDRHAGRMVASVLTCLGLTEFIGDTPEAFVRRGAELAGNLGRLRELRAGLRQRLRASPLCDGPAFSRRLEAAYRQMWQRWCARAGEGQRLS